MENRIRLRCHGRGRGFESRRSRHSYRNSRYIRRQREREALKRLVIGASTPSLATMLSNAQRQLLNPSFPCSTSSIMVRVAEASCGSGRLQVLELLELTAQWPARERSLRPLLCLESSNWRMNKDVREELQSQCRCFVCDASLAAKHSGNLSF